MNAKDIERFWSKVDKEKSQVFYNGTRCWEWVATKSHGYGSFWLGFRMFRANRIAWEFVNGSILSGLHVLHHCDNRACVNPLHLFLGTHQDNMDDKVKKGRQVRFCGESNGKSRLIFAQVVEIRERFAMGNVSQASLAREYGVSIQNIHDIVRLKRWIEI